MRSALCRKHEADAPGGRFKQLLLLLPVVQWLSCSYPYCAATSLQAVANTAADPSGGYSALCAVARNENVYLAEWVEYHKCLGIDRIYLYDHNSTRPMALDIPAHVASGYVHVTNFSAATHTKFQEGFSSNLQRFMATIQGLAYNDCIARRAAAHRFLGFIDIDEFIVLLDPAVPSINALLARYEDTPGLSMYWQLLGSNGHKAKPQGRVTAAYTACTPAQHFVNTQFKTFVNTAWGPTMYSPHRAAFAGLGMAGGHMYAGVEVVTGGAGGGRSLSGSSRRKSSNNGHRRGVLDYGDNHGSSNRGTQAVQRRYSWNQHSAGDSTVRGLHGISTRSAGAIDSGASGSSGSGSNGTALVAAAIAATAAAATRKQPKRVLQLLQPPAPLNTSHREVWVEPYMVNEHKVRVPRGRNKNSSHDIITVYHYVTKSAEDFEAKMARGGGAGVTRPRSYMRQIDKQSTDTCLGAVRTYDRMCGGGKGVVGRRLEAEQGGNATFSSRNQVLQDGGRQEE